MKRYLILILIFLIVLASCNDTIIDPKTPIEEDTTHKYPNCPLYDEIKYGQQRCDNLFSTSNDGKYAVITKHFDGNINTIFASNRYILDLKTGSYILIGGNEKGNIGGNHKSFEFDTILFSGYKSIENYERFHFCPYNSNIISFGAMCVIDTIGDGKSLAVFANLFTYNIQTKELTKITPEVFGKWGIDKLTSILWHNSSVPGNDIFLLGLQNGWYEFNLQTKTLQKSNVIIHVSENTIYSSDIKSFRFEIVGNGFPPNQFFLNEKEVFLYDSLPYKHIIQGAFSNDNKYLCFGVRAHNGVEDSTYFYRGSELWVIEVDKLKSTTGVFNDFTKINLRYRHCMNLGGNINLTPHNTILVSMYPHNSRQGNVYEMDLKGNILRKITNN